MRAVYLAVSIDVEPDCTPNWVYSDPLTFRGVSTGIKDILQPLFNKYDVSPTYLINNVVLENKGAIEVFKSLDGVVELGTHLHPEFIAPEKLHDDYAGKKGEANCCFLPPDIEAQKIFNITQLFYKQFGYMPASFRAGRFSAGINTMKTLIELGYKVDSSVTPGVAWNDKSREGIVDYTRQNSLPYWCDNTSFPGSGNRKSILEIPVSIEYTRKLFIKSKLTWLRPFYSSVNEMIRLSRKIISSTPADQSVILNMMFHNVEVMPALSPYAHDQASANKLVQQIEDYLKWCKKSGIVSTTLEGYYEKFR
jgi:hypothetical protein